MQRPVLCLSKELFKEGSRSHCCGSVICNDMYGCKKSSFWVHICHYGIVPYYDGIQVVQAKDRAYSAVTVMCSMKT